MSDDDRRPPRWWWPDLGAMIQLTRNFPQFRLPPPNLMRFMADPVARRAMLGQFQALRPPQRSSPRPSPPLRRNRRGRKPGHIALATKAAAAALHVYLSRANDLDLQASVHEVARQAANLASELGLEDADLLDPDAGAMRDLAQSMLAAEQTARRQK
jgi:hypothetical protein